MITKLLAVGGTGYNVQPPTEIPTGGLEKLVESIGKGISFLLFIAFTLSLIFLIWGGIEWIMSGGDKTKLQGAQHRITYAIIGLIISLLSFTIINFIGYVFNNNLLWIPLKLS
jgi:hypothetical protein